MGHFGDIVKLQLVVSGAIGGSQSKGLDISSLRVIRSEDEIAADRRVDEETFRYARNVLVLMLK